MHAHIASSVIVFSIALMMAADTTAQVTAAPSGIPGDGIPDLYYYLQDDTAPNGEFRRAGTLTLDTDGTDLAAILVSDANAHLMDGIIYYGNCHNTQPPCFAFTVGNVSGSTQWVRTFPLQGPGPMGIFDMAEFPGLSPSYFIPLFDDQATEELWQFRYATDSSGQFFSNITFVPEPHFGWLSLLVGAWVARRGYVTHRRRQPGGGNTAWSASASAVSVGEILRCTHPAPHGSGSPSDACRRYGEPLPQRRQLANRRRQPGGGNTAWSASAVSVGEILRCTHPAPHGAGSPSG